MSDRYRAHRTAKSLASWLLVLMTVTAGLLPAAIPVAAGAVVTSPASAEASAEAPTAAETHAFIVDMGSSAVTPQTLTNGVKPYGLVYALIAAKIPVQWVIDPGKAAKGVAGAITDSPDFTYGGKTYRGGPFVIPAAFYSTALPIVNTWRAKGVVVDEVDTAVNGPLTVPVYETLTSWPRAVIDTTNGSIAAAYYTNAEVPASAYRLGAASTLTTCDDIYLMPHSDPTWATHAQLLPFIQAGGFFWAECHGVSVVENVDSPDADLNPNLNFLSTSGLILSGSHSDGTPPFTYPIAASDPILQFIGDQDDVTNNGSEQIFLPKSGGWRPTTTILAYDPDHSQVGSGKISPGPAATLVTGRAFGNASYGRVLYQGGHTLAKATAPDNVAGQRSFFDFHLLNSVEKGIEATVSVPSTATAGGAAVPVSATISGGTPNYSYSWTSSCGGSFATASGTSTGSVSTTWTPPLTSTTGCIVRLLVSDSCSRASFGAAVSDVVAPADLRMVKTTNRPNGVAIGDTLTYTLTVTNLGPATVTAATVNDPLPAGTSVSSVTPSQGSCTNLSGTIDCALGSIANGASATVTIVVTVLVSAPSSLVNTATTTSGAPDPDTSNNSSTTTTGTFTPGIAMTKTPSALNVASGTAVTYTYLVTNTGDATLTPVSAVDDQCTPLARQTPDTVGDDDGTLEVGETWRYTCTSTLFTTTTNHATATFADPSGTNRAATAEATVDVVAPALEVSKSPPTQLVASGGTATFVLHVTNTGTVGLTDIVVADANAPGCATTIPLLGAGASVDITCTRTNVLAGFTNSATAIADNPIVGEPPLVALSNTVSVVVGTPSLSIVKSSVPTHVRPGDTFDYTVTVTNIGAVTQTGLTVTDVLPDGLTAGTVTALKPGSAGTAGLFAEDSFATNGGSGAAYATGSGWSTNWVETDPDNKVSVAANLLRFDPASGNTYSISRDVNLSTAATANLVFDCRTETFNSADDELIVTFEGVEVFRVNQSVGGTSCPPGVGGTGSVSVAVPAGALVSGATLRFQATGDRQVFVDNVDVIVGRVAQETFTTNTYAGGTGWIAGSWTETDANNKLSASNEELTWQSGMSGSQSGSISRTVNLSASTYASASVTLLCRHDAFNSADDFATVQIGGTTVFSDAGSGASACATTDTRIGPFPITLGNPVTISLSLGGDRPAAFDDVIITGATAGGPSTVTAGDPPTLTSAGGPYTLLAGEQVVFTIPVTVAAAGTFDRGVTELVDLASATSAQQTTPVVDAESDDLVNPDLDVTKSASETLIPSGGSVTYTVTVTNAGNGPLDTVVVDDPVCALTGPTGDTGSDGVLGLTEVWIYTCTTTLADDTTNTVTVNAEDELGASLPAHTAQATVDVYHASVSLDVSPAATTIRPDDVVVYTYTLENTGDVDLTNPGVSDPECAPIVYVSGDTDTDNQLDTDETWTFTCTTAFATDASRTVTGSGLDPLGTAVSDTDGATVTVIEPSIEVDKSVNDATPPMGTPVTYTITVENTGDDPLVPPTPGDRLSAIVDGLCAPVGYLSGDTDTDDILDVTETWTYSCTHTPPDDLTNFATATFDDSLGGVVTDADSVGVNVLGPDLGIVKVVDMPLQYVGGTLNYTVDVTNTGETTFHGADLTVSDPGCPLVRGTDTVGDNDTDLEVGETWRYTCSKPLLTTDPAYDVDEGDLSNTVTASGTDVNGIAADQVTDSAHVHALAPDIAVAKAATPPVIHAGDLVTYTYEVTNASTVTTEANTLTLDTIDDDTCPTVDPVVDLSGFNVGDLDLDGTINFDALGVSETWQFDCSVAVSVDTTNTVTVDATDALSGTVTATATASVDVLIPDIELTKTALPSVAYPGTLVTYSFDVENAGDAPLTNVDVADPACTTGPDPVPAAAPNQAFNVGDADFDGILDLVETWSFSCTMTLGADFTNTATATADDALALTVSDTDSAPVDVINPALTLDKVAAVPTDTNSNLVIGDAGDTITDTFTITNSGDSVVNGPLTIDDDLLGTFTCAAGPLAAGGDVSCDRGYVITQADLDAGFVTNIASAAGVDELGGDVESPTDTATTDLTGAQTPLLTIAKTSVDVDYDEPGDVLHYSYRLTNTGNVTLAGPFTVTDDQAADESCPALPATLAPGAFIDCTASDTVLQADLDAGSITNVASGHALFDGDPVNSATDDLTIDADQDPAITIAKTSNATGTTDVGDTITYHYLVTNTGNLTVTSLVVTDPMANLSAIDCGGTTSLIPTAFVDCTATYTVTQADMDAGHVDNTGTAAGSTSGGPVGDSDPLVVSLTQDPALTIVKSSTTVSVTAAGQLVPYSYLVTNTGNVTLTGLVLADDNTDGVPFCLATTLAPTVSTTCSAIHTVTQAEMDAGGDLSNTVSAETTQGAQGGDSLDIPIVQTPLLTIAKTSVDVDYDEPGDVLHYVYRLTNTGNVTLVGPFTVTDDQAADEACPALPATLAPLAFIDCTGTDTVVQADVDAGSITNVASGHALFDGDPVDSVTDTLTIGALADNALTVVKSSITTSATVAGQVIPYSYLVTNIGNTTLTGLVLVDDNTDAAPVCLATTLAPDASTTCSAVHTVTQAEMDAGGTVSNAVGADTDQDAEAGDGYQIPIIQTPLLGIVKSSVDTSYDAPGDVLHYSYLVTNIGNVTLVTPFTVTDDQAIDEACPPTASLAPGDSITCTATDTIVQADLEDGSVTNEASAHASFDGDPVNSTTDDLTIDADQNPALTITKSSTTLTVTVAGQLVPYSYLVTNTGNVTLTGLVLADDNTDGVPFCLATTLAPTVSTTCSAIHTVTQAEMDAGGDLSNTVSAETTQGAQGGDSLDIPIVQTPLLTIAKTSVDVDYDEPGDVLHYVYRLTNTGNVTLVGPFTVTDDQAADEACPALPATLAPLAFIDCTGTDTVVQADVDAGSITNVASGHALFDGDPVDSATDDLTIDADQDPGLSIAKSSNATVATDATDTITYSYLVTNTGNLSITALAVTDPMSGLSAIDCGGTTTLIPTAFVDCTATYTVTQADMDAGHVDNTGTAAGSTSGGPVGDSDPLVVSLTQDPAMTIVKSITAGDPYTTVGATITYGYVVMNTGNVTITAVSVSDDNTDATPVCDVTSLVPDAIATCSAVHTVTQADLDAGSVTNHASASGTPAGGTLVDPADEATALATQTPLLTIDKTSVDTTYDATTDVLHYSFRLTNTGNVTLTGPFTVTDNRTTDEACPATATLAPAAHIDCSASHPVLQADLDAGFITNVASGHALFDGDPVNSATDTLTIDADQNPSITIVKSSTTTSVTAAGQVVPYSYLVTNNGNVTLTGLDLDDDNTDADPVCLATTLAPTASTTCSAVRTVTQADVDAGGDLSNTVTADTDQDAEANDSLDIPIVWAPAISLLKTTTSQHFSAVGDSLNYTLVATNTGNITLDVTISDPGVETITCTPAAPATLAPGATMTCTGHHLVTGADLTAGRYANTATASGVYGQAAFVTAVSGEVVVTIAPTAPPTDKDVSTTVASPPVEGISISVGLLIFAVLLLVPVWRRRRANDDTSG